jgi:glycosyltransferase involved in cell wall biosynthesis
VASSSDYQLVKKEFGIPSSLIELSPNWIDIQLFKPLPVKKDSRVLFVGRLNAQKNLSLLLNALKETGITLDVVGNGELREELMHLAKKLRVKVNFLGMIPNEKMPAVYNRYKVYVLCSDYEGNPKTMLEAMACSCAVVGTNVPGIQGILQHKKNGILVQRNPEALREAIQCLFGNAPLRKQLGTAACQYIKMNNSLEVALKKEYAFYQQLCKN